MAIPEQPAQPTPPTQPSPSAVPSQLSSIQHIVQLMLENRSFDHMLGFLYPKKTGPNGQPFEGLMGTESNNDGHGNPVPVHQIDPATAGAYFMPGADPGEGYANTNSQLLGTGNPPSSAKPTNGGFVTNYAAAIAFDQKRHRTPLPGTVASNIMGIFTPAALPVLSGLAAGFAVCDHWYSSVPTETFPNRAFAAAATSQGHMNDNTASYTVPSIFGLMTRYGLTWKIYGYDKALGEVLIQQVYQDLRNGPGWNQTLLIITYDEHGGCYDHVGPPAGAVPPDSSVGEFGFDFTRFGVRVPAVLVSPLIAARTICRVPDGSMPIDHTSVLKTIERRWNLPALTARDAAAPDIGGVLTLITPRTDDPLAGVVAPTSTGKNPAIAEVSHLEQLHAQMIADLPVSDEHLVEAPVLGDQTTPPQYANYIATRSSTWKAALDAGQAPAG